MQKEILLDYDSEPIKYLCKNDKRLAKLISMIGPLSYSVCDEYYTFLIHEIIEQMLSVKAAQRIYERLIEVCDGEITPQKISSLMDVEIKSIGTSNAKVQYIRNVTEAVETKKINFSSFYEKTDSEIIKELTSIKGIGNWTAKMYLIFVLNRNDVLPIEDVAFLQSYSWLYKTNDTAKQTIEKKCHNWKPYSSIASRYLYRALDMGLTKQKFNLFK